MRAARPSTRRSRATSRSTRSHQNQEGRAFPLDDEIKYRLLLDVDALLFEINSCCELMMNFLGDIYRFAGKPSSKDAISKEIRRILKAATEDTSRFVDLDGHRNFFLHEGAPYLALDISDRPELLILKSTRTDFAEEGAFIRISQLAAIVQGFARSKGILQEHITKTLCPARSRRRSRFARETG